ncbi:hypothetical protein ND480_002100 [Salmonella enterica subsp. enterica serovar Bareilly]|nr:hypothetical protein [Salmonella enterica subsp. enterica serovar Bareilly]
MAIQDMINSGSFNGQYLLSDQQYNPTQSDVLGRYRNPTPTAQGLPNIDPDNDDRSAFDAKQQQRQANFDTLPAQDTEGKIIGNDGMVFNLAPDDRKSQLITGLIAYGTSYLAGENAGQSIQRAGDAVNAHVSMIKRQKMIPDLLKKGYADVDIQKYVETGNTTDLLTNMGRYVPVDGGYINSLRGTFVPTQQQAQQLPPGYQLGVNYTPNGPVSVSQDEKGKYSFKPATKTEIEASQAAAQDQGGGDGTESLNSPDTVSLQRGANNKLIPAEGSYGPNGEQLYLTTTPGVLADAYARPVMPGQGTTERAEKQQTQTAKENANTDQTIAALQEENNTVQQLLNSPGFDSAYGSYDAATIGLPFHTNAYNETVALREKLGGQIFLNSRQALKGQGPITDYESGKAESSRTILTNPKIGENDARRAARELIAQNNAAIAGLQKKKSGTTSPQAAGITHRYNPQTGKIEAVQ